MTRNVRRGGKIWVRGGIRSYITYIILVHGPMMQRIFVGLLPWFGY